MANMSLNLPLCTHRYFIMVSYIGTKYNGSQRLVNRDSTGNQDTIQEALEVSFESVFSRKKCRLTAASRTDKGVHALMNCYTLPLMDFSTPTDKLKRLVNQSLLKHRHEIIVNEALLVPADFHPRRATVSREYIYRLGVPKRKIDLSYKPSELFHAFPASELFRILPLPYIDMLKFEEAANLLSGVHDFESFSFQPRETDDTIRSLEIDVIPANDMNFAQEKSSQVDLYDVRFKSRAFLHNQVRRLVGAMLSYATFGTIELSDIQRLLDNPSSTSWNSKLLIAEPWGLYLSRLNYDKSSFEGAVRTYENVVGEEKVDPKTVSAIIDVNAALEEQEIQKA